MVQGPHLRSATEGDPIQTSILDEPVYENIKPDPETDFQTKDTQGVLETFNTFDDALREAQSNHTIWKISFTLHDGRDARLLRKLPSDTWSAPEEEKILEIYPNYDPHTDTIWVHTDMMLFMQALAIISDIPELLGDDNEQTEIMIQSAASIVAVYTFPTIA